MPPNNDDSPLETWEKLPVLLARISRIVVCGILIAIGIFCAVGNQAVVGACFVGWAGLIVLVDVAAGIKLRLEAILEELRRR